MQRHFHSHTSTAPKTSTGFVLTFPSVELVKTRSVSFSFSLATDRESGIVCLDSQCNAMKSSYNEIHPSLNIGDQLVAVESYILYPAVSTSNNTDIHNNSAYYM